VKRDRRLLGYPYGEFKVGGPVAFEERVAERLPTISGTVASDQPRETYVHGLREII
jgi:hypothetical protein